MLTTYYPGHLNGNYASIPTSAKFYVLYINVTSPSPHTHQVRALKGVRCVKDLGITISLDLSWSEHINVTINKANKLLGLVFRAEGSSNPGAFSTLYKSLVRPVLEYAAPVQNPYLVKDVLALERVKRRASRLALEQKRGEIEYKELLRKLKWPTLETR